LGLAVWLPATGLPLTVGWLQPPGRSCAGPQTSPDVAILSLDASIASITGRINQFRVTYHHTMAGGILVGVDRQVVAMAATLAYADELLSAGSYRYWLIGIVLLG
jgi:hypothetical protein